MWVWLKCSKLCVPTHVYFGSNSTDFVILFVESFHFRAPVLALGVVRSHSCSHRRVSVTPRFVLCTRIDTVVFMYGLSICNGNTKLYCLTMSE